MRSEREAQLRHGEALDTKAGVMLGFAGALAALAPINVSWFVDAGRVVSVTGALFALAAFWPRGYGAAELRAFRERYLAAEPTFARLHLADAQIAIAEEIAGTLGRKASRVRWSMALLAAAAILVAAGLLVD